MNRLLAVPLSVALIVALGLWACDRDEKPTGPPHVVRYPEKERQILLDGCVEDATWWHEENVPFEDYLVHAEKFEKGEMNKMLLWAMNAGEACLSE